MLQRKRSAWQQARMHTGICRLRPMAETHKGWTLLYPVCTC